VSRFYCEYCGHEFAEEDEGVCPYCDDEIDDYDPDEWEDELNGYEVFGSA
jgi:RNA polymerase subunit RPABC4/transcription elongation factor Spt4